jgi:hypothetical protein
MQQRSVVVAPADPMGKAMGSAEVPGVQIGIAAAWVARTVLRRGHWSKQALQPC